MLTLFAGIVMLGILVFVHELGHFCVAKLFGVKVLKFSLGFGPRLLSRQWGETEYLICAVPLGGYVLMLGEGNGEQGEGAELTAEEIPRSYAAKSVGIRTAIIAAGPLMNLAFPFIILPLAYMLGVNLPAYLDAPPCIGHVVADSEGAKAGFVRGDCILTINGDSVATWDAANQQLVNHAGMVLNVAVRRDAGVHTVTLQPENGGLEGMQSLGLLPEQSATIGSVAPGMPAARFGMQAGDRVLTIDGQPVSSWYDLKGLIQRSNGGELLFVVDRQGKTQELKIRPDKTSDNGGEYLVGIAPEHPTKVHRFGVGAALRAGAQRTMELIDLTLVFIGKLFTGHVSTKNIGGPISVMQIAGQAAQTDLPSIFSVLAFISIQLGILNLLPVPILDGGHLFFNLVEFTFRRPLSMRAREIAQQIGLALLLLLMVLAFYNDIVRVFFGG